MGMATARTLNRVCNLDYIMGAGSDVAKVRESHSLNSVSNPRQQRSTVIHACTSQNGSFL